MNTVIIENKENGSKYEITKMADNEYSVSYYEFYQSAGWRKIGTSETYTKDCIEWEFDIKVA